VRAFKDTAGRTWIISIHVSAIKRVRGLLGIDLYKLIDDKFKALGELLADPVQLIDVIYCLCKEEADKLGISDEEFGRAMGGDVIEHAANAFLEELTDFFPDARVRAALRTMVEKGKAASEAISNHAMEVMRSLTVEMMARGPIAKIDAEAKKLRDSFGNGQEPLVSTPILSRFEN